MSSSTFDSTENFKKAVIDLIDNSQRPLTKNEIAKNLMIKGAARVELKQILKNLKHEGYGHKIARRKTEILSRPTSPFKGQRIKDITSVKQKQFTSHIGLFLTKHGRGRLVPCHRKDTFAGVAFDLEMLPNLKPEDVVVYHIEPPNQIRIQKILGSIHDPQTYSLMAIYGHDLPHVFSKEALNLANHGRIPALGNRTDLREVALVTIDGEDAKDFDDAVWAAPDHDPRNPNGWRAIVAIADVAHYVRPGDALDQTAYERGNSVYFADRVIPMLPEALSNEMCSLKPKEERACLAVEMVISHDGKVRSHRFKRGLMRSKARLTYTQVQKAIHGIYDETTQSLWSEVLQPLYGVYKSLLKARQRRGTLDLNLPERKIIFNAKGLIAEIIPQERFESHQLIEELMIAANVCAAKTLLAKQTHTLFRIHETPENTRVENLKTVLCSLKIPAPRVKSLRPNHFQTILSQVENSPYRQLVNDLVLRCQAQACYSPHNVGHFGLSLAHYCHFTSPIRRYADLVVHRSLIAALNLGEGEENYPLSLLEEIGEHISATERTAALAEREVNDRLITAFLETHLSQVFKATIVGVTSVGIFVGLQDNGAQGFIPKSKLQGDYYIYDAERHRYLGSRTKKAYQLGQPVVVRLEDANPVTCSTTFSLMEDIQAKKTKSKNRKKAL